MQQQQPQQPQPWTLDDKYNFTVGLCLVASAWTGLFLAIGCGDRWHGLWTFISIMIGFLWIATEEPLLAPYFFYACIGLAIVQRIFRSREEHSQFIGHRWVTILLGLRDFEVYEFLLLMAIGVLFQATGHPGFGSWIIVSAIAYAIWFAHMNSRAKAVDRARKDAICELRAQQARYQQAAAQAPPTRKRRALSLLFIGGALLAYMVHSGDLMLPERIARYLPDWAKPAQRRAVRRPQWPEREEVPLIEIE